MNPYGLHPCELPFYDDPVQEIHCLPLSYFRVFLKFFFF